MNSESPDICLECGKPVPTDSRHQLCPACLMAQALVSHSVLAGGEKADAVPPPSPDELAPLFPQLEILELLGRGGMGAVYRVRQRELDRIVALKILPPGIGADPAFAERFAREAKALAKLNHPNIVTLYEFGVATMPSSQEVQAAPPLRPPLTSLYFFLMEWVDGVNLRQLLQTDRVSPREALAIVPEICDALQFAHDHGLVHRDIKPENILLDRRGRVKVADFGLAKLIAGKSEPIASGNAFSGSVELTEAGRVLGTPQYMAPEQTSNSDGVDHRADIYALGVVFYQMLTGELPDEQLQPPSRKVQIDVRLDEIVLRALEKTPGLRWQTAADLRTQVETIASEGRRPEAAGQKPEVEPRFSRTAIAGACWSLFAILAGLFWFVTSQEGGPGETPARLGIFCALTLVPLGVTAPFGTTILGWIAVTQIRRSAGKLYGLGLAVFDVLFFPLLALDAFLAGIGLLGLRAAHAQTQRADLFFFNPLHFALFFLGIVALVDFLLIRAVWRAVSKKEGTLPVTGSAGSLRQRLDKTFAIGCVLVLGLVLPLSGSIFRFFHPKQPETNAEAEAAALLFGPMVNGLQAALELKPGPGGFTLGKPVEVLFHIRNSAGKGVFVAGASWRQVDTLDMEGRQEKKINVQSIHYSGLDLIQRVYLQPGETAIFHSSALVFLPEHADEKRVTHPVGYYVKVKPGQFTVRFRLRFPDVEQVPAPPGSKDWEGYLETAPVTVDVKAPAPMTDTLPFR